MPDFDVKAVTDSEQLILLPIKPRTFILPTDGPKPEGLDTGMHCVVVSGFAGIFNGANPGIHIIDTNSTLSQGIGDDFVEFDSVKFTVGPVWRKISQVSASISTSGIVSRDSDEVDHSLWDLSECSWAPVDADGGQKIELGFDLLTQGDANGWDNFSYHVVATGDLIRMPTQDEISADL